ncbi:MAG: ATP-binding protein [Myxococcota bacterium]
MGVEELRDPDFLAQLRSALIALAQGRPRRLDVTASDGVRSVVANLVNEAAEGVSAELETLRERTAALEERASASVIAEHTAFATLSAGVGHELNTPLSYAAGNLEFVQEELETIHDDGDLDRLLEVLEALRDARDGVTRAAAVAADLKRLAPALEASSQARPQPCDLRETVDASLMLIRNAVHHRARLVCHYEPVPRVLADRARVGQILVNLVQNALQAMPVGRSHAENRIEVRIVPDDDGAAVFEVRDNGVGIPEENLARIFDSFFTTRPVGQGAGLGLALCKRMVSDQGGRIDVLSTVGIGTTMRVLLPVAP